MPILNVMSGHSRHMLRFTFKKNKKTKNKTKQEIDSKIENHF